jgi:hypothetical protein
MVVGGGVSVVCAHLVFGAELANHGEYSGAPTLQEIVVDLLVDLTKIRAERC